MLVMLTIGIDVRINSTHLCFRVCGSLIVNNVVRELEFLERTF